MCFQHLSEFLLYGAHTICFLPLVTILEPSLQAFLKIIPTI
jgi:hypothetical protein